MSVSASIFSLSLSSLNLKIAHGLLINSRSVAPALITGYRSTLKSVLMAWKHAKRKAVFPISVPNSKSNWASLFNRIASELGRRLTEN